MDKTWRDEQLKQINTNTSIFGYIPEEIGTVIYCDSTTGKATSKSTSFNGSDYFIGEKGFAKVSFELERHLLSSIEIVMFDDITHLCTSESEVWKWRYTGKTRMYVYSHTDCVFTFYGYDTANQRTTIFGWFEGQFKDLNAHFRDNPSDANEEYEFLKMIENLWVNRYLCRHQNDTTIHFPTIDDNCDLYTCVTLDTNGIRVIDSNLTDKYFKFNDIKSVTLGKENKLSIEHTNHTRRLAGIVEEGDIVTIDYSKLTNGKALLTLLYDKVPTISPPPPLKHPRNPLAVTGFVFSIISLIFSFVPLMGLIFWLGSVVMSSIGVRKVSLKRLALVALCICSISIIAIAYMAITHTDMLK